MKLVHWLRVPCAEAPVGLELGGVAVRVLAVVHVAPVRLLQGELSSEGHLTRPDQRDQLR
jgi:hypothetical protein